MDLAWSTWEEARCNSCPILNLGPDYWEFKDLIVQGCLGDRKWKRKWHWGLRVGGRGRPRRETRAGSECA